MSRLESDLGPGPGPPSPIMGPLVRLTRLFWLEELSLSSHLSFSSGQYGPGFFRMPPFSAQCTWDPWRRPWWPHLADMTRTWGSGRSWSPSRGRSPGSGAGSRCCRRGCPSSSCRAPCNTHHQHAAQKSGAIRNLIFTTSDIRRGNHETSHKICNLVYWMCNHIDDRLTMFFLEPFLVACEEPREGLWPGQRAPFARFT